MSEPTVSQYSADQVSCSLAGFDLAQGIVQGTFLTIERESDSFTEKVGSDGSVVISKNLDRRATVTIKVLQSSAANTWLSGLLAMHEAGIQPVPGAIPGKGPWELNISDRFSGASFHADKAWIVKPAKAEYGNEATEREWKIKCAVLASVPVTGSVDNFGVVPNWLRNVLPSVASAIQRALGL